MDDNTFKAILAGITAAGAMFSAWIAYKTIQISRDTKETKTLVNHNMEIQLELYAHSTEANARLLDTPAAHELAIAARKKYNDHAATQRKIDAKK